MADVSKINIDNLNMDDLEELVGRVEKRMSDLAKMELAGAIDDLTARQDRVNALRQKSGLDPIEFPNIRRPMGLGKRGRPVGKRKPETGPQG